MSALPSRPLVGSTVSEAGVHFRVWAPDHAIVEVELSGKSPLSMQSEGGGFWSVHVESARAGDQYRFRVRDWGYPDPYSRYQPQGPHGPSMVVDPNAYAWQDHGWKGLARANQVLYELHIGTFTEAGTYQAAVAHLPRLRDLGITCLELMPVNEFVGDFGWGYDGVQWFAPYHRYGTPDDLRSLVDAAHACGLGVILDVVYNHFGHDGNYLPVFAPDYLTDTIKNPWGAAPNYACEAMYRMAVDNAVYWIREYHLDGLRLDAIQNIFDPVPPRLLASIVNETREGAESRGVLITAEDYLQRTHLLHPSAAEGAGIDMLWNDDFHHACRVALTGNHTGFFANYRGSPQELLSCLKRGFLFQGQYDAWGKSARGEPVRDEPLHSFVAFLQNHDAVANTLQGQRLQSIVSPGKYRALTAVLLLGPQTPLIFMGQEFGATTPFAYFADYPSDAGTLLHGRRTEAEHFLQYRGREAQEQIMNPCSMATVKASTLRWSEATAGERTWKLHADLIALRSRTASNVSARDVDGAVLSAGAFCLRWLAIDGLDHLLMINLGPQEALRPWAEPLLAPPGGRRWKSIWSSESPAYGGMGAADIIDECGWQLLADSATLLVAA